MNDHWNCLLNRRLTRREMLRRAALGSAVWLWRDCWRKRDRSRGGERLPYSPRRATRVRTHCHRAHRTFPARQACDFFSCTADRRRWTLSTTSLCCNGTTGNSGLLQAEWIVSSETGNLSDAWAFNSMAKPALGSANFFPRRSPAAWTICALFTPCTALTRGTAVS